MSIDMYLGSSDSQAQSVSQVLQNRVTAYGSLQTALTQFSFASPSLSGHTYDSAKDYSQQVLTPLLRGCILLDEAIKEACTQLPARYRQQVDSIDLKESELVEKIYRADRLIGRYQELIQIEYHRDSPDYGHIYRLQQGEANHQELKMRLEEKLRKLREFNTASSQLFASISALADAVNTGLRQAKTAWNAESQTFTIPPASELGWATSLANQWDNKLESRVANLISKVESGKDLSTTELNELGRYLVENPESKIYDRGMSAFYSSIKGIKPYDKSKLPDEVKIDDDLSDFDAGVDIYAGKTSTGDDNLGASITALRAGASAGIMNPFSAKKSKKDGISNKNNTTIALGARVKAEVSAAEAEGHARYGDEHNNIHGNIYGASHTASAEASVALGKFTTEEGKLVAGAQAEVGVDAYILEGEAKAGFTLFGLKVDVSGSAGVGVSARAKVGVTTQQAEAKLKLGPVGLGLTIGW